MEGTWKRLAAQPRLSSAPAPREPCLGQVEQSWAGGWKFQRQNAMAFSSKITMATASSQRVATVPFQGLPQLGRKKGTQRGWGQWAGAPGVGQPGLGAASRCCVGHLAAHTPLLGQTQNKQSRSQERKGRTWHSRTGEGRDTASLGPGSQSDNTCRLARQPSPLTG